MKGSAHLSRGDNLNNGSDYRDLLPRKKNELVPNLVIVTLIGSLLQILEDFINWSPVII